MDKKEIVTKSSEDMEQMGQDWTLEQDLYLDWLSTPSDVRKPKTKSALAPKLGVGRSSLYRWEALPGFNEERLRRTISNFAESTPDIMRALRDKAKRGDTKAIDIWLSKIEKIAEQMEVRGEVKTVSLGRVLELIHEHRSTSTESDKSE